MVGVTTKGGTVIKGLQHEEGREPLLIVPVRAKAKLVS